MLSSWGERAGDYVFLARYLADGDLDTTFGDRGRVTFAFTSNTSFVVKYSSLGGPSCCRTARS